MSLQQSMAVSAARYDVERTTRQLRQGPPPLTPREQDVAALIVRGKTNREISVTLSISEPTVKSHVEHLFEKLGVRNRTELAVSIIRGHHA